MKEFKCIQVEHHGAIGKVIEENQQDRWELHSYQAAGMGAGPMAYKVSHYLLFERKKLLP